MRNYNPLSFTSVTTCGVIIFVSVLVGVESNKDANAIVDVYTGVRSRKLICYLLSKQISSQYLVRGGSKEIDSE